MHSFSIHIVSHKANDWTHGLAYAKQTEYLLYGKCHVALCCEVVHCLIQGANSAHDWEKGIDSGIVTGACIVCHASGKGQYFAAMLFGDLGNAYRHFAICGLGIQTSLSGDDDVCSFQMLFKLHSIQNDADTGPKLDMREVA